MPSVSATQPVELSRLYEDPATVAAAEADNELGTSRSIEVAVAKNNASLIEHSQSMDFEDSKDCSIKLF